MLTDGVLLCPGNITNIVLQYSYILILAIGMVIVIIGGHIDLSVGSVVALTGAVSAVLVIQQGSPWWVGVLAGLGVGVAGRGLAGLLGRVRRHPGVHRDPGRHAAVPRHDAAGARQRLAVAVPAEYQRSPAASSTGSSAATASTSSRCVIAAVAVAGYAVSQVRTRQGRIKYQQVVESMPLFVAKIALVGLVSHGLRLPAGHAAAACRSC